MVKHFQSFSVNSAIDKFCIITIIIIIFSQVQFFFNNLATSIKEATLLSIFKNLRRVHFSH